MADEAPLTLGTAGHIDHGKTALVRALTGRDTDRLPEERERGISIALGYAELVLPSGRRLSVVDAPGHERFVRTMVAGATGIDCFLVVVAADDGVMPQTREHARVLAALGVERGVVAVTKADRADPARATEEARALLPGVEVVPVSARTGAGVEDLRAALDRLAAGTASRASADAPARLHVDRVFTVRGAGTVVTGTLWSGTVGDGDVLAVAPGDREPVRVRGVHVHDVPVARAAAGQRVAVNLARVGRDDLARGDVLVGGGEAAPAATFRLEARLDHEPPARVMVHHGTRESAARAIALGDGTWQLRLQDPVVAAAGDRLVVRAIAPPDTLGGGVVIDPAPARRSSATADDGSAPADADAGAGATPAGDAPPTDAATAADGPADAGAAADAATTADAAPAAPAPDPAADALLLTLTAAGLAPPTNAEVGDDDLLARLRERGDAVRLGRDLHVATPVYADARDRVAALIGAQGPVTLAQVRDELGSSRRVVQALLERLDADKVTLRRGDERVLRRRRPA